MKRLVSFGRTISPRFWEKTQGVATLLTSLENSVQNLYQTADHSVDQVGFPVLTRAYDNNGRCPRQKLVFGILHITYYIVFGILFGIITALPVAPLVDQPDHFNSYANITIFKRGV